MKKIKTVSLLLIVFACLCSLTLGACSHGGESAAESASDGISRGNTNGNITNLGGAAEYNGMLYYQNSDDKFSIYRSELDGSDPEKLNDAESYFINVTDECIIYVNGSDNFRIYRMNPDGSGNTALNNAKSYYVNVYGDSIYYSNWSDGNKLYRMNLDGSDDAVLCEDKAYYVTAENNKIYYSNWDDAAKLYRIDADGSNKTALTDTGAYYIVPHGEWIYYSQWKYTANSQNNGPENDPNDRLLCRIKSDGSENEVIGEHPCGDINIYKDRVYYTDWINNTICSSNLDGSDAKTVTDTYGIYLNAAADKLFFVQYDKDKNASIGSIDIESED